ncbi:MAG: hypothetical protein OT477_22505 [Chloroflexi bacterium]|nr:hypothetical protein [Chloroflexota bacterium]
MASKTLSIRVPVSLWNWLKETAEEQKRSTNNFVNAQLLEAKERAEAEKAATAKRK